MLVKVLGTGSKGNCTVVKIGDDGFLIDAGLGMKRTMAGIRSMKLKPEDMKAVMITHAHGDHAKNAYAFEVKFGPSFKVINLFEKAGRSSIPLTGRVSYTSFELKHDVPCMGVVILDEIRGTRLGYVTDTHSVPAEAACKLRGVSGLIIEFNHEVSMLAHCNRPDSCKSRAATTHMSNKRAAICMNEVVTRVTQHVIPFHKSEGANSDTLINGYMEIYKAKGLNFKTTIACQKEATGIITLL